MRICDVCKNDLTSSVAKVTIPSWIFSDSTYTYDMCKDCAEKVHDYIEKLRKEAEQKKKETK